jgi:multidrug resistance efflux pump
MKRFNLLYIFVILIVVMLWNMNLQYQKQTVMFYGFAENKETEINLEHPIQVDQIFISTGQKVAKGEPLIEVSHNKLPQKLNGLVHEEEETKVKRMVWEDDIRGSIDKLISKKAIKESEINAEIEKIKAKVAHNRTLVKGLANVSESDGKTYSQQTIAKIAALEQELKTAIFPLDTEIGRLRQKLKGNNPYNVELKKLRSEQEFYEDKGRKLSINAPSAGLIGNVHCKEAENIPAFRTLITFYEENPTLVKGYVHEKAVIHVNIGDTLMVGSSLQKSYKCQGVITGLGSRIIEIPDRLRKYPEIKNYGREVLIKISSNNKFLQKEKVILKLSSTVSNSNDFFDFIFAPSDNKPTLK